MNRSNLPGRLAALVLLIMLAACQDKQIAADSPPMRIKRITKTAGAAAALNPEVFTFRYNESGKLTTYFSGLASNEDLRTTTFSYTAQGQLTSASTVVKTASGTRQEDARQYEYDAAGHLVQAKLSERQNGGIMLTTISSLTYGTGNSPTKINREALLDRSLSSVSTYTYSNGNVTSVETTRSTGLSTATYQFDNKPNPLYGLLYVDQQLATDYVYLSRNNVVSPTSTLTYDGNGLLIKKIDDTSIPLDRQTYYTYEYETY